MASNPVEHTGDLTSPSRRQIAIGLAALVLVSWVLFGSASWDLGLYDDDWYHYHTASKNWRHFFLENPRTWQRPLEGAAWMALHGLFGTNLTAFYLSYFALQTAGACLLYLSLLRAVPRAPAFALLAALLLLATPAEQTHFWLSTIAYRAGLTLFSLALYASIRWCTGGCRSRLAFHVSWACYLLAMLGNEMYAPMGLLLALPAVLARATRGGAARRLLVSCGLALLAFGGFRVLTPMATGVPDGSIVLLGTSFRAVAEKLASAYRITLRDAWVHSWIRLGDIGGGANGAFVMVVVLVSVALAALLWGRSRASRPGGRAGSDAEMLPAVAVVLAGLVGLAVSYGVLLPTHVDISLGDASSRTSIPASLAAALLISGIVWLCSALAQRVCGVAAGRVAFFFMAATVVAAGSAQHVALQQDYRRAWAGQVDIWNQLIERGGELAEETFVLVVGIPRWEGATRALANPWEITSALRLLYDDASLSGDVLPDDQVRALQAGTPVTDGVRFGPEGLTPRYLSNSVPYSRLVLLECDAQYRCAISSGVPAWASGSLSALRTNTELVGGSAAWTPARALLNPRQHPEQAVFLWLSTAGTWLR